MQVREPRMAENRSSAVIDSSEKFLQLRGQGEIFSPLMSGAKNRIFASFAVLSHRKLLHFLTNEQSNVLSISPYQTSHAHTAAEQKS